MLGLAARVWQRAELAGAAAGALLKLRAAGIDAEETTQPGIEPRLQTGEAAFGPLWQAVRDRRPVTFGYRAAGRSAPQQRHLEPWGVVNRHGRWYVAGHDTDRGEVRVFRLSRIDGPVTLHRPGRRGARCRRGPTCRETVRAWDIAARRAPHRRPADPQRGRARAAPARHRAAAGPGAPGLGPGRGAVLRRRLVRVTTSRRSAPTWSRSIQPTCGRRSSGQAEEAVLA